MHIRVHRQGDMYHATAYRDGSPVARTADKYPTRAIYHLRTHCRVPDTGRPLRLLPLQLGQESVPPERISHLTHDRIIAAILPKLPTWSQVSRAMLTRQFAPITEEQRRGWGGAGDEAWVWTTKDWEVCLTTEPFQCDLLAADGTAYTLRDEEFVEC